jgi:hypothetical protein
VAEGAPLLREYRVKSLIEGSNPSLSARLQRTLIFQGFFVPGERCLIESVGLPFFPVTTLQEEMIRCGYGADPWLGSVARRRPQPGICTRAILGPVNP